MFEYLQRKSENTVLAIGVAGLFAGVSGELLIGFAAGDLWRKGMSVLPAVIEASLQHPIESTIELAGFATFALAKVSMTSRAEVPNALQ